MIIWACLLLHCVAYYLFSNIVLVLCHAFLFGMSLGRSQLFVHEAVPLIVLSVKTPSLVFWTHFEVHFRATSIDVSVFSKIHCFFFYQVMLLWPKYRTRSCYSYPANECSCWEFIMFHCIKTNECARST